MTIIEKTVDLDYNPATRFKKKTDLADYLLMDIETTGFSSIKNSIFLIGCLYFKDDQFHLVQWLCEKEADEYELLYRFSQFIKPFKYLVHYNGTSFDIPFVSRRMKLYNIYHNIVNLQSMDVYAELKQFDRYLGFESLKLKDVEKKYGFNRNDKLTGRKLIHLYKEMLKNPSNEIASQLLGHNKDDLIGLLYCLKGLEDINLFKSIRSNTLKIQNVMVFQNEPWLILSLSCQSDVETVIDLSPFIIHITPAQIITKIPTCNFTLKHYYPDYKHYYYLPLENCVVHKSVGQFVDKAYRENATKENCYVEKRGIFIPLPKNLDINFPLFKQSLKDTQNYVELTESLLNDHNIIRQVFESILSRL